MDHHENFKRKGVVHFGHLRLGLGQRRLGVSSDVEARGRIEGLVSLQVLCGVVVLGPRLCHV